MRRIVYRVLFALALLYVLLTHIQLLRTLELHFNDFGKFYYSVVQWREHGSLYGRSPATFIPFTETTGLQFWNMNPPHFHLLILPLSFLPVAWAFGAWTAANLAAMWLAIAAIYRRLDLRIAADRKAWLALPRPGRPRRWPGQSRDSSPGFWWRSSRSSGWT